MHLLNTALYFPQVDNLCIQVYHKILVYEPLLRMVLGSSLRLFDLSALLHLVSGYYNDTFVLTYGSLSIALIVSHKFGVHFHLQLNGQVEDTLGWIIVYISSFTIYSLRY